MKDGFQAQHMIYLEFTLPEAPAAPWTALAPLEVGQTITPSKYDLNLAALIALMASILPLTNLNSMLEYKNWKVENAKR